MESIILVLVVGGLNILSFLIGARTAQKLHKGEEIELPKVNPMQVYREHREEVEASKEQKRLDTMLENINNYDGTGAHQKDIL